MDYNTLKEKLLKEGTLFKDTEFRAKWTNLTRDIQHDLKIEWKRPGDIVSNPLFVKEGASRFDLHQGEIGDCWFIAAVACMTLQKPLFVRCIPEGQSFDKDYAGIFHFKFWQFNSWVDVVIDDLLPTRYGKLVYCYNQKQPNEFWGPLIEKAYAKLYGNYENIVGGFINDALVDMTGGVSERISLRKKEDIPANLYLYITKMLQMTSLMGCSIDTQGIREEDTGNGLYAQHAYSITKLATVEKHGRKIPLIRIRNPWGMKEWRGAWGDRSSEWISMSLDEKQRIGLTVDEDGEFWMSYEEWEANFHTVEVCHLYPDAVVDEISKDIHKKQWEASTMEGEWIKGFNAGGAGVPPNQDLKWINPQYHLTVINEDADGDGKNTLLISLMQKSRDMSNELYISFFLYKLRTGAAKLLDGQNYSASALLLAGPPHSFTNVRECTDHYLLDPGTYVIIPSTYDPDKAGKYLLRVFSEKKLTAGEIDIPTQPTKPTPDPVSRKDRYEVIFERYAGDENLLDAKELAEALNDMYEDDLSFGEKFDTETARTLLAYKDANKTGRLSLTEFLDLCTDAKIWRTAFSAYDKDKTGTISTLELQRIFTTLEFDISRHVTGSIVKRYGGKSNTLSFVEFSNCLCKTLLLYKIFHKHKDSRVGGDAVFSLDEFMQVSLLL